MKITYFNKQSASIPVFNSLHSEIHQLSCVAIVLEDYTSSASRLIRRLISQRSPSHTFFGMFVYSFGYFLYYG